MKSSIVYDIIILVLASLLLSVGTVSQIMIEDLRTENEQIKIEYDDKLAEYKNLYEELKQDYALLEKRVQVQEETIKSSRSGSANSFTEEEIYMLARCVEAEAGHYENHSKSQKYVAQVILNRLRSDKYPNTLEGVIYQKTKGVPQFSVAWNGTMSREVTQETLANVREVLSKGTDLPNNVFFFYSEGVKNNWVNTRPIYTTVQGTVFAY